MANGAEDLSVLALTSRVGGRLVNWLWERGWGEGGIITRRRHHGVTHQPVTAVFLGETAKVVDENIRTK